MKILITEKLHQILIDKLEESGFECNFKPSISFVELERKIHNYQGLVIRSKFIINRELIEKAENLQFIGRLGAGMENIDTDFAAEKGILCLNSPEGNRDSVGEHAVGMLLSLFHKINKADTEVKNGIWQRDSNRGNEIQGKTVGIIGYGNMGKAFAKRLSGFDVSCIFYDIDPSVESDNFAKKVNLQELFEKAEILSLHVPLTHLTDKMVNADFIYNFIKPFTLINTARGQVVCTTDLVEAMKSGKIVSVALDVLENEDSSFETFNISYVEDLKYLMNSDNVILTPHIAGRTFESEEKLASYLAQKIVRNFGEKNISK